MVAIEEDNKRLAEANARLQARVVDLETNMSIVEGVVQNRELSSRAFQDDFARRQQSIFKALTDFRELRENLEDDISREISTQLAEQLAVAKIAMENEIAATLRAGAAETARADEAAAKAAAAEVEAEHLAAEAVRAVQKSQLQAAFTAWRSRAAAEADAAEKRVVVMQAVAKAAAVAAASKKGNVVADAEDAAAAAQNGKYEIKHEHRPSHEPLSQPEPKPGPMPEPAPKPEPSSKLEPKPELTTKCKTNTDTEPEPEPEPEPEQEPEPVFIVGDLIRVKEKLVMYDSIKFEVGHLGKVLVADGRTKELHIQFMKYCGRKRYMQRHWLRSCQSRCLELQQL